MGGERIADVVTTTTNDQYADSNAILVKILSCLTMAFEHAQRESKRPKTAQPEAIIPHMT